ncbi:putative tetratricopeptide-like helical [Rosellinia necatrix]|uniref:Putative tetratricopeptide-like helical n=1 Tax=Rosellinia necatrix TaxID=77044 RepID=A0A1W2TS24_ROSNE|nr:putative tetratricopeptide-like helical [Rosellinia necatrix]
MAETCLSRAAFFSELANDLANKYDETEDMDMLDKSIRLVRQSMALAPEHHSHRAVRPSDLEDKLSICYAQMGDPEDLKEAIRFEQTGEI